MKIEDATAILKGYDILRKMVKEKAKEKLTPKGALRVPHALLYLELTNIYVEGENIIVSFEYNEPYSGSEEVILSAADLEG